ncbi:MAG: DUF3050 domain-containing protein [Candidatus Marinamargulisbacteria bacterium]
MSDPRIQSINDQLAPIKKALVNHSLYTQIQTVSDVHCFMSYHVYSVWDFMNLLKWLQRHFTCVSVPWRPVASAKNAQLINEIVLEEESDNIDGQPISHFLYYVSAINSLGETPSINTFLENLNDQKKTYEMLIRDNTIPLFVQKFLIFTFDMIHSSILHTLSAFAFGREILVPLLFEPLVKSSHTDPRIQSFIMYLERHIELDGNHHGKLAEQMVLNACSTDADWAIVLTTAKRALNARLAFWDGISNVLMSRRSG